MKNIYALLFILFSFIAFGYGQGPNNRTCASMEVLARQLKENPGMDKRMEAIEQQYQRFLDKQQSSNKGKPSNPGGGNPPGGGGGGEPTPPPSGKITIPVVVHVVWYTGRPQENISEAQIASQIAVLNEDFRKNNAENKLGSTFYVGLPDDTEVEFCLVFSEWKESNKSQWGTNDAIKSSKRGGLDAWDANRYLNIWVGNIGGGILGYAQFPGGKESTDGIVVGPQYFGRIEYVEYPYDLGRTATHEVGHWLNLRHIWGDTYCGSDFVDDTPTHNTANYGCPSAGHTSTCSGSPLEMWMNYMDYTYDACMYMFSGGQKTRMRALFASDGARYDLLNASCSSNTASAANVGGEDEIATPKTNSTKDLRIFPNVVENAFTVELFSESNTNTEFGLYDLQGRRVFSQVFSLQRGQNVLRVNIPNVANGVYLFRAGSGETKKIVVRK